jgi:flagellar M-ring protein FliF
VIGLCGVLLVLFVLRPVATQMTATLREPMLLPAETAHVGISALGQEQLSASSEGQDEMPRARNKTYQLQQGIFEQVSEHIRREPGQSTRLIEAWIGTSEERL